MTPDPGFDRRLLLKGASAAGAAALVAQWPLARAESPPPRQSELIRAESDGDRLNLDELRMLVAGFLMAGTDTTRNQLAASVQVLCEHPDQWAKLSDHPGCVRSTDFSTSLQNMSEDSRTRSLPSSNAFPSESKTSAAIRNSRAC